MAQFNGDWESLPNMREEDATPEFRAEWLEQWGRPWVPLPFTGKDLMEGRRPN